MIKKISVSVLVGIIIALGTATSISAYAQQQTNFAAILTGKGVTPPVNTAAKGDKRRRIRMEACVTM